MSDVLALTEVAAGRPRVLAGFDALDREVRWVHVAPVSGTRRLLLGGELLLTTGVGWESEPRELEAYVDDLVAAGAAGLILELGDRFDAAPPALVTRCQRVGLPLAVLEREVRFVSITEAVHALIIDSQSAALRERDRVHEVFATLNRRGCTVDFLLDQVARMIGSAVVLEDLNHRALAWSSFGHDPGSYLDGWVRRSRRAARAAIARPAPYERTTHWAAGGWLRTPVEALGRQWGSLIAVDCDDVPSSGEVVLENAALALSLARLAGRDEWTRAGHRALLDGLIDGAYVGSSDLHAAFEATGFRTENRTLVGAGLRGPADTFTEVLARVRERAPANNLDVVCGPWSQAPGDAAIVLLSTDRDGADREALLRSLLGPVTTERIVVAVGPDAESLDDLAASADAALGLLPSLPVTGAPGIQVHHARSAAFAMLMYARRGEPALQEFVEETLGPLLAYDAEHGADLVEVARAYVRHPTNRKRAATECHLSRSVFYQRLDTIERLLDVDLRDGDVVGTLHAALVAHGQL
ncbi:PucR family transcriptional regulator [Nocardioidaceae bacterium SCSIO 66511]|nr:PucR family transcriptional regulator [Nocardioidaceae bacterium SCSIO 66511]